MKKLILSIIATVSIAAILPMSAFADGSATISGNITNGNGSSFLTGASVTAYCNNHHTNAVTSGPPEFATAGAYSTTFPASKGCSVGQTVTVIATYDGKTGQNTGTVGFDDTLDINVATVNVPIDVVPELGALTATGATVLGGAAFMVVRRKHISQN